MEAHLAREEHAIQEVTPIAFTELVRYDRRVMLLEAKPSASASLLLSGKGLLCLLVRGLVRGAGYSRLGERIVSHRYYT